MYKKTRRTLYSITQYIYSTSSFCSITKQKKMHIAYKKRVREREKERRTTCSNKKTKIKAKRQITQENKHTFKSK